MRRRVPLRYQTPGIERVNQTWVAKRAERFREWASSCDLFPDGPGGFAGRMAGYDVRVRTTFVRDCAGPVRLVVLYPSVLPLPASASSHHAIWQPLFEATPVERVERDDGGYTLILPWNTEPEALPALLGFFSSLPREERRGYRG